MLIEILFGQQFDSNQFVFSLMISKMSGNPNGKPEGSFFSA